VKTLFKKITDIINALAIIGLLLAYLSPLIDPIDFWPISFFGLTYKFWLALNLFLLLLWLVSKRKRWIYNGLILLIGYPFIARNIQINDVKKEASDIKVCSFNTNVQQVYNNGNTTDQINQQLTKGDYDVVILIEWLNKKGKISSSLYPHQQFVKLNAKHNPHDYGILVASKYKIVNWEKIKYNHLSNNLSAYFDIDVNGDVVRFVGTHLQSNYLSSKDYHRMMNVETDEDYRKYAWDIISKIKKATFLRSSQTKNVVEVVDKSPYPVVIVGDFNDTPQSYTYQQLKEGRKDAFIEKGNGWGATYLKPIPLLRIDYILYDKELTCTQYSSSSGIKSDHKLLEASFKF
jgi:endonuclease/exonuclease/phosphatase family metal-dependent hydrolase